MEIQTITQPNNEEDKIIAIMRRLPPAQSAQVLAFARFIAHETFAADELSLRDDEEFSGDTDTENDARWAALLASEEGQSALDMLADEALAEIRAGNAKPLVFTGDGEIVPR